MKWKLLKKYQTDLAWYELAEQNVYWMRSEPTKEFEVIARLRICLHMLCCLYCLQFLNDCLNKLVLIEARSSSDIIFSIPAFQTALIQMQKWSLILIWGITLSSIFCHTGVKKHDKYECLAEHWISSHGRGHRYSIVYWVHGNFSWLE